MNLTSCKNLTIALGITSLVLLIICGGLCWQYGWLTVRVAWASEQTKIFSEMRNKALQSDVSEAVACLSYIDSYYPSGSKQEAGSRLDHMVEYERTLTMREILIYLRTKTGEDLGENPEAWIQKYLKK